jgi:hypothetical protein
MNPMKLCSALPLAFLLAACLLHGTARAQLNNAALGKPVTSSGPVFVAERAATRINDGSASTFSHPALSSTPANFKYTIDLGRSTPLNKLRLINRGDCCPERLTNYRLSIFAEDPALPATTAAWTAVVRANGTNSGLGGVDEVTPGAYAAGVFAGRWLRIQNLSNLAYQPQVAEFEALTSPNLALYKRVTASGPVPSGFTAVNLTDGNPTTISYPDVNPNGTAGFTYELDLAGDFALDRLVLYARQDALPERLRNFRVVLLADNAGTAGAERWRADLRTDGSFPGLGSGEVIRPEQGTGEFRGRFVRITNLSNEAGNPQMAEIEAYQATAPLIRYFTTTTGNMTNTGAPGLPAQATLSWDLQGASTAVLNPGNVTLAVPAGTLTVTPAMATTYTISATNVAGISTATLLIAVDATAQPPRINEFMAENTSGLTDEDGSVQDWIELANPNPFTLPLAGAALSDDIAVPGRWVFPLGSSIPPNGFLTLFASGKNRSLPTAPLHTNFELKKSGETLSLYDRSGTLLDRVPANYPTVPTYPPQTRNTSYGIDGSGQSGYFRPATPDGTNAALSFTSVVADTVFLPKRGFYTTPQSVTITTATPGAVIRYTTNGTRPTDTTGTIYSGPVTVNATTVLRAAAFLPGAVPTDVDTHTYVFPNTVQSQSTMQASVSNNAIMGPQIPAALTDLPSISLTLPSTAAVNQDTEVETAVEWLNPMNALENTRTDAGITNYGGAYTSFNKLSFRLYFRAQYGKSKWDVPLFSGQEHGLAPAKSFDSIELRSGSHDMAMRGFSMSNLFADQVLMEMGHLAPHGRMVHLYLNGRYWGMYHLRERWNAAMHADYLGGSKEDYEAINGNLNVGGWADPGTPYDGDGKAWEYLKTRRGKYAELRGLADVLNLTDYMITFMFGNSEDEWRSVSPSRLNGAGSGARFILNDGDGWLSVDSNTAIAAWDGDDNNTARSGSYNSSTGVFTPGRSMGDGPASLLSAFYLAGGADYKILLADRIHRHLFGNGVLTRAANDARLRTMCTAVERAFIPDSARWSFDTSQNRTWASWKAARDVCLAGWIPTRTTTVLSQFRSAGYYPTLNAPVFSQNGGTFPAGYQLILTVSALPAGASVLYTMNGSDPRLPGGSISSSAMAYAGPFPLNVNTIVRARTRTTAGVWSALQEAFFQESTSSAVPAGSVLPVEIHFHPAGDEAAEFTELMNVSNGAVNLRGCQFVSGINFAFSLYRDTLLAPGQRLVLVESEFIHRKRYGWDRTIAGIYTGKLSNGGDTLIFNSGPNRVFGFDFSTAWQPLADGGGPSLTLIRPRPGLNLTEPSNWRPSSAPEGSPAVADSGSSFSGTAGVDADGDGLTAFVEYALGSSDSAADSTAGVSVSVLPGGTLRFSYARAPAADDAIVIPEVSPDMVNWHPGPSWLVPSGQEKLPDGRLLSHFTAGPDLLAAASHAFFHLRIAQRP